MLSLFASTPVILVAKAWHIFCVLHSWDITEMEAAIVLEELSVVVQELVTDVNLFVMLMTFFYIKMRRNRHRSNNRVIRYSLKHKITRQLEHMHFITSFTDETCKTALRMSMDCFRRLCYLLENVGGLSPTRNCLVAEQLAMFLNVLSHHNKNRVVKDSFKRSGFTVSKHFHRVLNTLLKLHTLILVDPEPIPDDCTDERWKYFKVQ